MVLRTHCGGTVLRGETVDLLLSLRMNTDHRGRPTVRTDDQITDLQLADGPKTLRGQHSAVQWLCPRSEERRVGKECRSRWSTCDRKKNNYEAVGEVCPIV